MAPISPTEVTQLPGERCPKKPSLKKRSSEIDRSVEALAQDFGASEIWLFGSAAGDGAGEQSDIDLLVVRSARPDSPRPSVEARLCLSRRGIRRPFDLLVLTPERWSEARKKPFGVYADVLRHGIKLYER